MNLDRELVDQIKERARFGFATKVHVEKEDKVKCSLFFEPTDERADLIVDPVIKLN